MSELTADKTFYVRLAGNDTNNGLTSGNAFLTPQRAADETLKWRTGEFIITVDIGEGEFDCGSALTLRSSEGENIVWTGVKFLKPSQSYGIYNVDTSVTALDTGLEYIDFDISFDDVGGDNPEIVAGQYILVWYYDFGTHGELLSGCHEVIAWNNTTWVATVRCVRVAGSTKIPFAPAGHSGGATVIKTILNFNNSTDGLVVAGGCHAGTWDNIVVKGVASSTDNGVLVSQGASIVLGPYFGTSEWGTNLKCQSNGVIDGSVRGPANYTSTMHSYSYGCLVSADSGGVISINGVLSGAVMAAEAYDNGTINLQDSKLSCAGHPVVVKATKCGSINAANTTVLGCVSTGSTAFYMATEGHIDSTGATSDAEKLRNPVVDDSDKALRASKTFYVRTAGSDSNNGLTAGTAFLTPSRATEAVKSYLLGQYEIDVNVGEGIFDCATSLSPGSNEGANISWAGVAAEHTSLMINNIDGSATALSTGLEYIDFDVNFAADSGAAVGQFILVKTTSGGTNPNLVKGCHEIIAYSANVATVRCVRTANVTTLPSGTITANTLTLVKTIFDFNGGSHGVFVSGDYHAGNWDNMVLKGDLVYTGIWMSYGATIVLGVNFGTSKWLINLNSQSNSSIQADDSIHSYGKNYLATVDGGGFMSLNNSILSGCWATALRAYDGGKSTFVSGQVACGGTFRVVQAFRGGYITTMQSVVEGCPSGSIAFYATSGGGIDASGSTNDATTSYATEAAPGGNGAYVAY